ncbi:PREDICTED: heat shock 70 kDa protein 7, chloroplastic-like isoform X1 [Brassica oleracea var. oleracea]|uniref:heat shock 70 kDa protein 7, chloroplastic-like isoform X1 n=1 Tax=Brassica oleracea var. oleracea TaxID=109376 RepID=UPI0006A70BF9|nr:PREDICTED: heat shock 70 kDa protein 7, chloroplastic-like isoform X1 [Brassica oleracea var. oleracea]
MRLQHSCLLLPQHSCYCFGRVFSLFLREKIGRCLKRARGMGHCSVSLCKVITHEDENGNVKLECPAIGKQQFAAGRFHIDSQRTATKDVDRIVGLDVLRIIKESTATSLAYAFER